MAINDFNFDTENIIIFHFPRYAGGKFIQNCLGLSDNVVFQKQSLAQTQIDGTFSFNDKKEYILTLMQDEDIKENEYWADLHLGCSQLFVSDDFSGSVESEPDYMNSVYRREQHSGINNTVRFLSSNENDKLLFSLNWHDRFLHRYFFPNAKIITFKNNAKITRYRFGFLTPVKKEIFSHWDKGDIDRRVPDFTWDTEWLNDVSTTTDGLKKLYRLFNLDGWEQAEPFIKEYYHLWCEKNHMPIS
tara:strand:- start:224 stop:958 length:735 start_codon:yes stop_codon:yes gene_type:complete